MPKCTLGLEISQLLNALTNTKLLLFIFQQNIIVNLRLWLLELKIIIKKNCGISSTFIIFYNVTVSDLLLPANIWFRSNKDFSCLNVLQHLYQNCTLLTPDIYCRETPSDFFFYVNGKVLFLLLNLVSRYWLICIYNLEDIRFFWSCVTVYNDIVLSPLTFFSQAPQKLGSSK